MGDPANRLRGLYLSTGVERPRPERDRRGWRFHLAVGRTEVGERPPVPPGPREPGRPPATDAAVPRRPHPRIGDHPEPPRSHAAAVGRGLFRGRWRAGCASGTGTFPRVELPGEPLARPVVLVRHALPFQLELDGRTVPTLDPEPSRPVPRSGLPLSPRRPRAVRRHVASLSSGLGLVLDLRLDPVRGFRLHPDGRTEVLGGGGAA